MKLLGKIIVGFAVFIVAIGVIGAILGLGKDDQTSTSENTTTEVSETESVSQPTQTQTQTQTQTITQVAVEEFIDEFDKNQLAAEEKYKGKRVEFSAKIKNISEDILGSPFLSFEPETADEFYFGTTIQCFFKDKSDLINLENEQVITARGTVDTQSLGIIVVKDCQVIE